MVDVGGQTGMSLRRVGLTARLEVESAVVDIARRFRSSSCGEVKRPWLDEECLLPVADLQGGWGGSSPPNDLIYH
jgi:hypothetical protein